MARKSRKGISDTLPAQPSVVYRTGLYARKSLYDKYFEQDGSIEYQMKFLEDYVSGQPDLYIAGRYEDNGWSGTDFQRPAFLSLVEDITYGKINCLVVKDFSRFGRNYLEVGYYLQNVFPKYNIRFIAINENFDSLTSDSNELYIILKNLMNEFYSLDLSRKVSSAYDLRASKGVFARGTPYGYKYDEEKPGYLVKDPEIAPYVDLIFGWVLDGVPFHQITMNLRELKVPTQTLLSYKRNRGRTKRAGGSLWNNGSLRTMIINPVYTGDFVCGRQRSRKYEHVGKILYPKEEWVIIPDAHPAYITHEQHDYILSLFQMNREQFHGQIVANAELNEKFHHPAKGLVFCGKCGRVIHPVLDKRKPGQEYSIFACHGYGNQQSSPHSRVAVHSNLVLSVLQDTVYEIYTQADLYREWLSDASERVVVRQYIANLTERKKRLQGLVDAFMEKQAQLFDQYHDNRLTNEELQNSLEELRRLKKDPLDQLAAITDLIQEKTKALSLDNPWLTKASLINPTNDNLEQAAKTVINQIIVVENQKLRVEVIDSVWYHSLRESYQDLTGNSILPVGFNLWSI